MQTILYSPWQTLECFFILDQKRKTNLRVHSSSCARRHSSLTFLVYFLSSSNFLITYPPFYQVCLFLVKKQTINHFVFGIMKSVLLITSQNFPKQPKWSSGRKSCASRRIGWFGAGRGKKTKSNARLKSMEKKSFQTAASKPIRKQERRRIRKEVKGSQCAGKRGGDRVTSNAQ